MFFCFSKSCNSLILYKLKPILIRAEVSLNSKYLFLFLIIFLLLCSIFKAPNKKLFLVLISFISPVFKFFTEITTNGLKVP